LARSPSKQDVAAPAKAAGVGDVFRRLAHRVSMAVGTPGAFLVAVGVILVWAVTGPLFQFSDTWQLVINTGTTIVTFLMVFLIQNAQNRDARAFHLKLDELLRGVAGARTGLVNLEDLPDDRLAQLEREFRRLQTDYGIELTPHQEHLAAERDSRRREEPHGEQTGAAPPPQLTRPPST
jgi:low affinity Fe/Cu permease